VQNFKNKFEEVSASSGGHNVNAALFRFPLYPPVFQSEKGMIAPHADVTSGVKASPALAHEDPAREDFLTIVAFYPEALCIAIATVATGSLTFFVCHGRLFPFLKVGLPLDALDPDNGKLLAVAALVAVALAPFLL
jgi:hypothetical protein